MAGLAPGATLVDLGAGQSDDASPKLARGAVLMSDLQPVVDRSTPDTTPAAPAGKSGIIDSIERSTGNMISTTGRTVRDVAPGLGLPLEKYGTNLANAHPASVTSLSDIVHDPLQAIKEGVAEAAPQVATTIGSAAIGAAAGAGLGSIVPVLGTGAGAAVGGMVGAFAPNLLQEYGTVRQGQDQTGTDDKGKALVYGGAAAAVDMLDPEFGVARKVGTKLVTKVAEEAGKKFIPRTIEGVVKGAGTEAVQTGLERAGGNQSMTDQDAVNDYAVSAFKGGVGAGVAEGAMGAGHKPGAAKPGVDPEALINPDQPHDLVDGTKNQPAVAPGTQQDLFPGAPRTSPMVGVINGAAQKNGADPGTLLTIARLENTTLDPNAKNPKSSAGGLFQFTDGTWTHYKGDKLNAADSADAAAKMLVSNKAYLSKTLGREPAPWELYMAHQQGPGGAATLLKADPNASAVETLKARGLPNAETSVVNNGGKATDTVAEFLSHWQGKYERAAGEAPLVAGGPMPVAAAPAETADAPAIQPMDDASILAQMRQAGAVDGKPAKASSDLLKLANGVTTALNNGDHPAALDAVAKAQAVLDAKLHDIDAQQTQLDAAKEEHSKAEQARFQSALSDQLDALIPKQNAVAAAKQAVIQHAQLHAPQGELNLQQPEPFKLTPPPEPAPQAATPATPPEPALAPGPHQQDLFHQAALKPREPSPTLFPEPSPVAQPAAGTGLAHGLASEHAEQSIRNGLLTAVLQDPGTRNPEARFIAQLKRAGRDITITPEERDAIDAHNEQLAAHHTAEAERAQGEDTALGVPERQAPAEQRQRTVIQPRPEKASAPARPFELTQQTPADLAALDKAQGRREAKAARPVDEPAGPTHGDLFDPVANTRRRADAHAETLGSSRKEWFRKGVEDVVGERQSAPAGKSKANWFEEGRKFASREMGEQHVEAKADTGAERVDGAGERAVPADAVPAGTAAEEKAAPVERTAKDQEAFDTQLEYALDSKAITSSQYQVLKVLSEQNNVSAKDLEDHLQSAMDVKKATMAKFTGARQMATAVYKPPDKVRLAAEKAKRAAFERRVNMPADQVATLTQNLRKELDRIGLHDVGLKVANIVTHYIETGLRSAGLFTPMDNLIRVAYDANDVEAPHILDHEAMHALQSTGVISQGEWRMLQQHAMRDLPVMEWVIQNYGKESRVIQLEEAVAEGYARWRAASKPTTPVAKIFRKIEGFFNGLRRALTRSGFKSADEFFKAVESGEIGHRARTMDRGEMYDGLADMGFTPKTLPKDTFLRVDAAVDKAIDKLPGSIQGPTRELTGSINGAVHVADMGVTFTQDLIARAKKLIPSAAKLLDLVSVNHALARHHQERIADIKRDYQALPARLQGNGPSSVNDYVQSSTDKMAWGYQPKYLGPVKVDPEMEGKFKALPLAAQNVVKAMFAHNYETRRDLLTNAVHTVNAEYDPQIAAAADPKEVAELQAEKVRALAMFSRLHDAPDNVPYSPKTQSGEWIVHGMSAEMRDARLGKDNTKVTELQDDPAHNWVRFFSTEGEAKSARSRIAALGKYDHLQVFKRSEVDDSQLGGRDLFMAFTQLRHKLQANMQENDGSQASKTLYRLGMDMYLHSLAQTSARKGELARNNIPNRDPVTNEPIDMMRAFVSRGQALTHFIAATKSGPEIHAALGAMADEAQGVAKDEDRQKAEALRSEILYRYVTNLNRKPSRTINAITHGVSFYNLLLSPAYFMQNASQAMALSMPMVAGRTDPVRATAQFIKAYADIAPLLKRAGVSDRLRFDQVPADVKDAVHYLVDRGSLDAGLTGEINSWGLTGGGAARKAFNTIDQVLRYLPQNIESMNRLVTGIAAYRTGKGLGDTHETAAEYARKVVYETHGDYSGFNEPGLMARTGNAGKIPLQFRKFQFIQAHLIARQLYNSLSRLKTPEERWVARKALAYTLGTNTALTGLVGFPAASLMGPVVQAALNALLPPDEKKKYDQWDHDLHVSLEKFVGKGPLADMLFKGVPYAAGVDLSGKLGMANAASPAPFTDASDALKDKDHLMQSIGELASGALGSDLAKGVTAYKMFTQGDVYRGFETMLPNGLMQAAKAYRLSTEGLQATNGDHLISPEEMRAVNPVVTALGFTPRQLADLADSRSYLYQENQHYVDATTQMKARYVNAQGDAAKQAALRQEWMETQAARRAQGLKGQPLSDLVRAPVAQKRREGKNMGGLEWTRQNRGAVQAEQQLDTDQ